MKTIHRIGAAALAGASLALSSCSTGYSPSGFLSNLEQLDAGYGTANAVSAYVKPDADLKKYDSVIIDPVTTVVSASVSPAVKEQVAAYLGNALRSNAAKGMKVVSTPGPTTIRVRTALTDVIENSSGAPAISTVQSSPSATLTGNLGSQEVANFISKVSFEGEILDSQSGERLSALIDHRSGVKRYATPSTPWADVKAATEKGATNLWNRFKAARSR